MSYANLASEMALAIDEAGEIKSVAVRGAICELLVQVKIEMVREYEAKGVACLSQAGRAHVDRSHLQHAIEC